MGVDRRVKPQWRSMYRRILKFRSHLLDLWADRVVSGPYDPDADLYLAAADELRTRADHVRDDVRPLPPTPNLDLIMAGIDMEADFELHRFNDGNRRFMKGNTDAGTERSTTSAGTDGGRSAGGGDAGPG